MNFIYAVLILKTLVKVYIIDPLKKNFMICAGIRADPKVVKKIVKLISRFFFWKMQDSTLKLVKIEYDKVLWFVSI